ncbi:hypothetical protein N9M08_07705 [Porticoccaceae bacterium]|nr:hypothetical protein [Porticoccaceae bacterium]MDB2664457.1 hypothetical protein [Porticoccaceae bacterium]
MEIFNVVEGLTAVKWAGSIALVIAGLFIDRPFGKVLNICGAICLLIQGLHIAEYNIIFLQVAGMSAISISLYRQIKPKRQQNRYNVYGNRALKTRDLNIARG